MQHPIISMVKTVCKQYGVRFIMHRGIGNALGGFDEGARTLHMYTRYTRQKGRRRGKPRVEYATDTEILMTAIHEMTHMCQWKRGDVGWHQLSEIHNERMSDLILLYAAGEKYYNKADLYESALTLARLEFEAEITSIRIMELFGEPHARANATRNAKAYAASFLVLALTGIMIRGRQYAMWHKYLSNSLIFDIDGQTLRKLCDIAIANRDLSYTIWDGKICIKSTW